MDRFVLWNVAKLCSSATVGSSRGFGSKLFVRYFPFYEQAGLTVHISVFSFPSAAFEQKLLAYADDVNLLGDNIDTIKKNTKLKLNSMV
jgi:hypothetical protein